MLGDLHRLDDRARIAGHRKGDQRGLRRGNGGIHALQLAVDLRQHRQAEPEQPVLHFRRHHRGDAAGADAQHIARRCQPLCDSDQRRHVEVLAGALDGRDRGFGDGRGDALLTRVAAQRLRRQILAADGDSLCQVELEIAQALAAEIAAEARHRRFADADARGNLGDCGLGGEVEIGQNEAGQPAVRFGAVLRHQLQPRDDVGRRFHARVFVIMPLP